MAFPRPHALASRLLSRLRDATPAIRGGVAIGVLLFAGWIVWIQWRNAEPSYHGRSASAWLEWAEQPGRDLTHYLAAGKQVEAAFGAMGREAAPVLARELRRKPTWLENRLAELRAGPGLPAWLKNRIPERHEHRRLASELLLSLGPDAQPALPVLLRIFREGDDDEIVQANVNATLMALAPRLEFLVPELIQNLRDGPPHIQILCANLLERVGPGARAAVPALERAVESGGGVSRHAAWALLKIDGQTNTALRVLTQSLGDANPPVRLFTLLCLRELGPAARPAASAIQQALRDPDSEVRKEATETLRQVAPELLEQGMQGMNAETANQVDRLTSTIRSAGFRDQARAIEALPVFGPEAAQAVPVLIDILRQATLSNLPPAVIPAMTSSALERLQTAATTALGAIGPKAAPAVPLLAERMRTSPDGALECCRALRAIGAEARAALPALHEALINRYPLVRVTAARALIRIDPTQAPSARRVLDDFQGDPNPLVRMAARVGLWEGDRPAPSPIPMLIQALGPEPRTVQEEITSGSAAELLGEIGPEARDALPALVGLFRSGGSRHTQRRAAIAIRCIDPETYAGLGLPGLLALP